MMNVSSHGQVSSPVSIAVGSFSRPDTGSQSEAQQPLASHALKRLQKERLAEFTGAIACTGP
jgi:hypothetical protein